MVKQLSRLIQMGLPDGYVVSERKEVQGPILQVFQSEGVFHVFVGGELFLWDGINLKKQNFSKDISAFLAKDNFFYIGFKQDPNIYGFQSATLKPLGRKQIGIDGYHPWSFSKSGAQNVVTLRNSSLPYINRFEYMAVWSDQEYFSDDLWVVTLEQTIFEERKPLDGDNFGVSIPVNAEHDYIKIVRQGMAAVDDAISRHAVSILPSSKDRPYSQGFNGQIEVVFEKAKNLDANQRKQLTQGMEKIQTDYEIAFKGFANGKFQPIKVKVIFKD